MNCNVKGISVFSFLIPTDSKTPIRMPILMGVLSSYIVCAVRKSQIIVKPCL